MNEVIKYDDPKMVLTLKQTVAQGLSDQEFLLFTEFCRATGLNPFKREIWAIKAGNRLQLLTGLNGFLAIANSHPEFDGMQVEVDSDEKPTRAVCRVYRKDRKFPAEGVALMKEYGKESPTWRQMPRVMLTKVAKSIAIREAFPQQLNGLYTEDEFQPDAKPMREAAVVVEPLKPVEPTWYRIENETKGQTLFMSKRGKFIESLGAWCVEIELEPREIEKLAPYRTTLEEIEARKAQSAALIAQVEPVGEPQKVEREETPLEKAKKRVEKMLEGIHDEVI